MSAALQTAEPAPPSHRSLIASLGQQALQRKYGEAGIREHFRRMGQVGGIRGRGQRKARLSPRRVRIPAYVRRYGLGAYLDWCMPAWVARLEVLLATAPSLADERACLRLLLQAQRQLHALQARQAQIKR